MAISAKELPKNHTDKERFAAASSCIPTEILTLLFARKRRRSSSSPFISHRVLEVVASQIFKSLIPSCHTSTPSTTSSIFGELVWYLQTSAMRPPYLLRDSIHYRRIKTQSSQTSQPLCPPAKANSTTISQLPTTLPLGRNFACSWESPVLGNRKF